MDGQECRITTREIDGNTRDRTPYPPDYDWMPAAEFPDNCQDCGVRKGGIHHEYCSLEECPIGDGQFLSCEHGPHA